MSIKTAIELIKQFEGLRLTAYPDPASGGDPWTAGYGATGPTIDAGTVWTLEQAESDLDRRVTALYGEVCRALALPLPEQCIAAMTSFTYNVGLPALRESTLLRLVNLNHAVAAADEFLRWTHAAGHVMAGLVKRRARERQVFLDGLAGQTL